MHFLKRKPIFARACNDIICCRRFLLLLFVCCLESNFPPKLVYNFRHFDLNEIAWTLIRLTNHQMDRVWSYNCIATIYYWIMSIFTSMAHIDTQCIIIQFLIGREIERTLLLARQAYKRQAQSACFTLFTWQRRRENNIIKYPRAKAANRTPN